MDYDSEVLSLIVGAILGIIIASFITVNYKDDQIKIFEQTAVDKGFGQYCIEEIFVWNDESCYKDKLVE